MPIASRRHSPLPRSRTVITTPNTPSAAWHLDARLAVFRARAQDVSMPWRNRRTLSATLPPPSARSAAHRRFHARNIAALCAAALLSASCSAPPRQRIVRVHSTAGLERAVVTANRWGGHVVIQLTPGTYTLNETLVVTAPQVTLQGPLGTRRQVVIQGDGMSPTARIGNLIRVSGSHFTLSESVPAGTGLDSTDEQ